ncbi:MAPEG family protein [Oleiagrimonas sp.]|jgi:uncharacterized MAPEG superfamily protein|uniref:MAPEG family protein n=1 Tax=Oleiagrimonas sp. TaxID=2010330 RepID=UPI0026142BAA|nr:MAPEG family protein [Oleiagrimonas sp.]MDA3912675.1 MAPEG family protein [Oleiagrimonas sp.]
MHMNVLTSMLVWSVFLGLVQVVLVVLAAIGQRGLGWAVSPRDQNNTPFTGVGGRLQRALRNFLETFPMFAAVTVAALAMGRTGSHVALGAELYFWARLVYVPVYAAGIPWLRTLVWAVSIVGIVMIALSLF